jgi:hypothetical protein
MTRKPLKEGIHYEVNISSNCWEWLQYVNPYGYGTVRVGKKKERAHRVSYVNYKGPIPKGLLVCHTCDNRKCINPKHLFLGTVQDNTNDRIKKHGPTRTKLRVGDVLRIRELASEGIPQKYLMREFDISRRALSALINRRSWKHV